MAAPPPSEQSPSNKEMHRSSGSPGDEDRAKDPPPSSPPVSSPPPPAPGAATTAVAPTYRSSENSESYVLAKQLLNADNFEEALAVVEEELIATTAAIRKGTAASGTTGGDGNGNDDERRIELHESLAPLHYLYGTTLLYSLEEAKDDGNDTGAMMTDVAKEASTTATTTTSTTPLDLGQQLSSAADAAASPPSQEDSAMAEDIQIAWENLEAARTIVEQMLLLRATESGSAIGGSASDLPVAKLQLDLAQIHLREGDLQRINGNYTSAVEDYSRCLEILLKHNNTRDEDNNPRALDRKIADTQFNLGLTYLTSSSDLQKELANSGGGNDNKTGDGGNTQKAALLAREHCEKGIQQHVDCAKTFCGILANLCGVDPETVVSPATGAESVHAARPSAKPAAGFKTTGLEPDRPAGSAAAAAASQTLNVWRKAVATVVAAHAPPGPEDSLRVSDIVQVLDEIQETVDEAERSQEGVRQAAQIRLQAQQAAAGEDGGGGVVANPDGSTTTIGFGTAVAVTVGAAAASGAVGASSASAKPVMMVVKKKKKRKDLVAVGGMTDGDDGANKRSKTD
eukprot:CAMPEP_0201210830 /NCGR_PEP_ID=MMETSP0851-20130426/181069_1 /ASSEMBLY_ACC=CAM_ASM_000631 /TAXON_ID=183588 /ORGANISM="Pseudo-nitzschia fraudulenta, Strain WWA7" /LENGTH=569 /DNA_ID=CAMNT_0047499675 /DNA_START=77 /DNA_END=1786 /DNA_ORIENTATION=-